MLLLLAINLVLRSKNFVQLPLERNVVTQINKTFLLRLVVDQASLTNQKASSIANGNKVGKNLQEEKSAAIGFESGLSKQKESSIAIGPPKLDYLIKQL